MRQPIFQDDLFKDKVILVTGGATGIGASITQHFAQLKGKVIIASRKEDKIKAAAEGLSELTKNEVLGHPCDIRERDAVQKLVDFAMETHGRIDVLINNGGGQFLSPAENIRPRGWDSVISTNLTGTWK